MWVITISRFNGQPESYGISVTVGALMYCVFLSEIV